MPKPSGIDIAWSDLGNLIPILRSEPMTRTPVVEGTVAQDSAGPEEEDEIKLPENVESESAESSHEITWADVVSYLQLII